MFRRSVSGIMLIMLLTGMFTLAFNIQPAKASAGADAVVLVTTMGNITIELFWDMPITTGNFENLTRFGVYDGTLFHRVVPDFVIQGGDASSKGIVVPPIPDELPNKHSNIKGSVAMAKTSEPNSARSQFYINLNNNSFLDNWYSVFGRVIAGLDVVDGIGRVMTDENERPLQNVTILKAQSVESLPTYVQGIDVSHHQGYINWTEVYGAGYKFAFVKATEGDNRPPALIDSEFTNNMKNGSAAGLLMGAYHYAHPEMNNAVDEARFFVNVSRPYLKEGYLRPVLDLEEGSGLAGLSQWVCDWMKTVEDLTGVRPILYTGPSFAAENLNSSVADYDLWIAHWTYDLNEEPTVPAYWDHWDFWQWSNESQFAPLGYVPGVQGNALDLDVFNGDLQTLIRNFVISTPVPWWVRVGTQAEYLMTNLKNASETAVWKWEIVSVAADQIEVLHTFLWERASLPNPDYPSVFKSTIDLATRGVTNVTAIDKALPPGYSCPFGTYFDLWVPFDMKINDTAFVMGPYLGSYHPAPVLRFENISSPLETETCVTMGFEIETGYPETDLWSYNIHTNVLVKWYMNWPHYNAEEIVMLTQWVPRIRDVAIMNVSPRTVVGQGYSLNVSVTAANQGDDLETCNVTVYANNTQIGTQLIALENGTSKNMAFTLNTSGFAYGNCTICASVLPVPGETDTEDNNFACGTPVHVGVPGDISGPTQGVYDGTCNMRDIQYLILLFTTKPSSPNWNPNADINNDGTVNMRDIQIAILNFTKHE